jgi:hypothetical protein
LLLAGNAHGECEMFVMMAESDCLSCHECATMVARMEITSHSLWTMVHGMGFGALYLLGCTGLLVALARTSGLSDRVVRAYFVVMVLLAWFSVLSGAYIVYPWYRAVAPAGTTDLAAYPQLLLRSHANTVGWHSLGMEWKEHVAWFTPIAITAAAAIFFRYGRRLREYTTLRSFTLCFVLLSFVCAGIAGFWGAMINKVAPIEGGHTIVLMTPEAK